MGKPRHICGGNWQEGKKIYTQVYKSEPRNSNSQMLRLMRACVLCHVWFFGLQVQVPLSRGFFRQEYWSRLPFSPPTDIPTAGIEPTSPAPPSLQMNAFLLSHQGSPHCCSLNRRTHSSTPVKLSGLYFIKYNVMIFQLLRPKTWDAYLWLISFSQTHIQFTSKNSDLYYWPVPLLTCTTAISSSPIPIQFSHLDYCNILLPKVSLFASALTPYNLFSTGQSEQSF